jgi:iron complex transport system ATP-binding protein
VKIEGRGLTIGYGKHRVIRNIDLDVKLGEIVTIIGANGSGKTTVLKALSRNLKPESGGVYIDGREILDIDTKALARQLAILPQIHSVPDDFTVRDLVSYGRFPHLGFAGRLGKEDLHAVDRAIELTHLEGLQYRNVTTLSGGERQRAWVAMALAQEPEVLLLDEPTTFLDISHQFELLELIKKLNREMSLTIVMVLHDLNQAARYSHRLLVLKDGRIYRQGTPEDIITGELLADVFNIHAKIMRDPEYCCPYFIPIRSRYA